MRGGPANSGGISNSFGITPREVSQGFFSKQGWTRGIELEGKGVRKQKKTCSWLYWGETTIKQHRAGPVVIWADQEAGSRTIIEGSRIHGMR